MKGRGRHYHINIYRVEEYEDAQHDVLHKSVAGESSGPDSPLRVTVTFPRLTNQNWLAKDKKTTGLIQSSKAYVSTFLYIF